MTWFQRFLIVEVLHAYGWIAYWLAAIGTGDNELFAGVAFGIGIGFVSLIAMWGALAEGTLVLRVPWMMVWSVLLWHIVLRGTDGPKHSHHFNRDSATTLGVAMLVGLAGTFVPLSVARFWRWRLVAVNPEEPRFDRFSLGHAFFGATLACVALALIKFTLPSENPFWFEDWILLGLLPMLIVSLLITLSTTWIAPRAPAAYGWPVVFMALPLGGIPFAVAEYGAIKLVEPLADGVLIVIFSAINALQCWVIGATLLILLAMGFRLVRASPDVPKVIPMGEAAMV
jgi:hypothetical protein